MVRTEEQHRARKQLPPRRVRTINDLAVSKKTETRIAEFRGDKRAEAALLHFEVLGLLNSINRRAEHDPAALRSLCEHLKTFHDNMGRPKPTSTNRTKK
jgi:hypothetical protein